MNTIAYDNFALIAAKLNFKSLEKLFYTGNKRVMELVTRYPIDEPVDIHNNKLGKLFIKYATFIHHFQDFDTGVIYMTQPYTKKITTLGGVIDKFDCRHHDKIIYMNLSRCLLSDYIIKYINLEELVLVNPTFGLIIFPTNLRKFSLETHSSIIKLQKFQPSMEQIELIGNINCNNYVIDPKHEYLFLQNMRVCINLSVLKLHNIELPSDLFRRLPLSLIYVVIKNDNMIPIDLSYCTQQLTSLEIDCKVVNLEKLPLSLTKLVVHKTDITDFSWMPKLLTLHDLYERSLDTRPRNYKTLPDTLLDLRLSDRHLDNIDFDVIMSRCQKLSRFIVSVSIPGYTYINDKFVRSKS